MQVSVETLEGLERKVIVSVPMEKVNQEVETRLKDLARTSKIDGFRPGKAPVNLIKQRYAHSVRFDVAKNLIQSTLKDALDQCQLKPVQYPDIELLNLDEDKDMQYAAKFEIFSEFEINELDKVKVELVRSEVKESDVDAMLETMRENNQNWVEVKRAVKDKDKVIIDFEGFIDDTPFEGGKAEGHELIIGSNSMIPGFEEGLLGAQIDKPFDLKITFPKDYGHADLAGKKSVFKVTVKKVFEGKLPDLDDAFAEKFNVKDGVKALKEDIRQNMTRELGRKVKAMNRERIFDVFLEKNPFDLPKALIDQEIDHLKHEMFHQIFGPEHHDNEKVPDFPRSLFEAQAIRRVHLGLLLADYVKKHNIKVSDERVNEALENLASAYESPEEVRQWYRGDKQRLNELQALVMEEMIAEKIILDANVSEKSMKFDAIMNPKPEKEKSEKKGA